MKKYPLALVVIALFYLGGSGALAQGLSVNNTGATAATSAILDVSSTTQGVLVPRMSSTQRSAISAPVTGLVVYQTDAPAGFYYYNGSVWALLNTPSGTASGDLTGTYPNPTLTTTGVAAATYGSATTSPTIAVDTKGRITTASNTTITGVVPGGTAGGNLSGTYPNPSIASLPAIGAASITGLTADNLTGSMPAISATNLTTLNASHFTTGTVAAARLGTGTPSSSTFLRGDNTWQTVSGGSSPLMFETYFSGTGFATYYTGIGMGMNGSVSVAASADIAPTSFTVDAFYIYGAVSLTATSGTQPANVVTGTLYKNGSATAVTLSITMSSTAGVGTQYTASDLTHTVSVSAGDLLTIRWSQTNFLNGAVGNVHGSIHAH